jgi:hypothetical protein
MPIRVDENFIVSLSDESEGSLTKEIKSAIDELECARKYFDFVEVPELIEYAIYREKAAQARLSYLIKKAKFELPSIIKI